jgi:hypothetical protein
MTGLLDDHGGPSATSKGRYLCQVKPIKLAWLSLNIQSNKGIRTTEINAKRFIFKSVCARAPQEKAWQDIDVWMANMCCRPCTDPEKTGIEVKSIVLDHM